MNQTVLVCGGRDYADQDHVFAVLDRAHAANPIKMLIHGAATGADTLAATWAAARGIPATAYPALWIVHRHQAGPIRNLQMLKEGKPNVIIAFPGGRGTVNMIAKARAAKVDVVIVKARIVTDGSNDG